MLASFCWIREVARDHENVLNEYSFVKKLSYLLRTCYNCGYTQTKYDRKLNLIILKHTSVNCIHTTAQMTDKFIALK